MQMPPVFQLTLGTLKLEDTDYAIDAEQAQELLPLWKAARSLSESETTAAEEIEAVIKQINNTMTEEQLDEINAMQLSFEAMRSIAQEFGFEFGPGGGRFENLTPEQQATIEAARESGQFPGPGGLGLGFPGGGPGGGPDGGFGAGLSPEARQTAIAERGGARGATFGLNPFLIEAIIEFLEGKVQ